MSVENKPKDIDASIKSKAILGQTIKILCSRHWDMYLKESLVGGNREMAKSARHALDSYSFAIHKLGLYPDYV